MCQIICVFSETGLFAVKSAAKYLGISLPAWTSASLLKMDAQKMI